MSASCCYRFWKTLIAGEACFDDISYGVWDPLFKTSAYNACMCLYAFDKPTSCFASNLNHPQVWFQIERSLSNFMGHLKIKIDNFWYELLLSMRNLTNTQHSNQLKGDR